MSKVRLNWQGDKVLDEVREEDGAVAEAMALALFQLHRYATGIVHVDTGRLKNSLFIVPPDRQGNDLVGAVATQVEYAPDEHNRGGSHAFFSRTLREEGPNMVNDLFAGSLGGRIG